LLFRLAERGLACTRVVIEAETEHGERLARCWRHDRVLTPARSRRVRWQLDGWLVGRIDDGADDLDTTTGGLVLLRLVPDEVVPATAGSSVSGAATRPRTTAPTARSPACRACSATTRSRPRSCRAAAPRLSRSDGSRGAMRASPSVR